MSTYYYSIATQFGNYNGLKLKQLEKEIDGATGIAPTVDMIRTDGDMISIKFDTALTTDEQTALDTVMGLHTPNTDPPKTKFYSHRPRQNETKSTTYDRLGGSFTYGGSENQGNINYISVIAYKEFDPSSYSVRVYDRKNQMVIAEATNLTNTNESIIDLGTISNVPTSSTILEIQAKRADELVKGPFKSVYVDEVTIYYDNV